MPACARVQPSPCSPPCAPPEPFAMDMPLLTLVPEGLLSGLRLRGFGSVAGWGSSAVIYGCGCVWASCESPRCIHLCAHRALIQRGQGGLPRASAGRGVSPEGVHIPCAERCCSSLQPPESPKIVEWQCRSRATSEGVAGQGSRVDVHDKAQIPPKTSCRQRQGDVPHTCLLPVSPHSHIPPPLPLPWLQYFGTMALL